MDKALLQRAEEVVRLHCPTCAPLASVVLGSGASPLADALTIRARIPYASIPGLGPPEVSGHAGNVLLAEWDDADILIFQGRRHRYEGVGWEAVILPVFLTRQLGARFIVLTNAAGGVNPTFQPGDWMVIDDHINLMGDNPLIGAHDPDWGPRFPSQHEVYSARLRGLLHAVAAELGLTLRKGIYAAVSGPLYETPAECRALRVLGVDAVGMSTVPEASFAAAVGLQAVGLSCIANRAAEESLLLAHDEVTRVMANALVALKGLLERFFRLLRQDVC